MKKTMFALLLACGTCFAQVNVIPPVVQTPETDAILAQAETEQQVRFLDKMRQMLEQSKLLMEAKERMEQVNELVRTGVHAKSLFEHQVKCHELFEEVIEDIDLHFYANILIENAGEELIDILIDIEDNIEGTTVLLKSSFYKMDDADRIVLLKGLDEDLDKIENKLKKLQRRNERLDELYGLYEELSKR